MKITRVSVEVRETVSLPGYANASRGITLEGKPIKREDWDEVRARLQGLAVDLIHQQIDDVLEAAGEPPKYRDAPDSVAGEDEPADYSRCDGCGDPLDEEAYCEECYMNQAAPPHVYSCSECGKDVVVTRVKCGDCSKAETHEAIA